MKKKFLVLFVAIFLIILSSNALAGEFCLMPFDDGTNTPITNSVDDLCLPGALLINLDQTTLDDAVAAVNSFETGCCCDGVQAKNFGNELATTEIFEKYCEAAGFTYKSPNDGACFCGDSNAADNFHDVTGYLFANLLNNPTLAQDTVVPLQGGFIQEDVTSVDDVADESGSYTLTQLPGIINGQNKFLIYTSEGQFVYDDTLYFCTSQTHQESITQDTQLNFTLTCLYQHELCDAQWIEGEWSECVFVGDAYIQTRDVEKGNQSCDNDMDKPPSVQACTPQESAGTCGNDQLESVGEQCEFVDGNFLFVDPTGDSEEPLSELACNLFSQFSQDEFGEVGCTGCAYDYSLCTPNCDGVCDTLADCDCAECANMFFCNGECTTNKPLFLNTLLFEDFEFDTTRNVIEMYQHQSSLPSDNQTGIWYREGTNDVELRWKIQDDCRTDVVSYEVRMCEESPTTSRSCSATYQTDTLSGAELIPTENFFSYTFEDKLEPETSYCYNVCLTDKAGNTRCAFEREELPCFQTGVEYCMNPHPQGLNCLPLEQSYAPQKCQNSDGLVNLSLFGQSCDSAQTCVETDSPAGAECKPIASCGACNGLFGLFGHYNFKVLYDGEKVDCKDLVYVDSTKPTGDNEKGLCYFASPFATQQIYSSCDEVQTCYNYTNQESCEVDSCYKFTDEDNDLSGCEWVSINEDVGTSVCRPKDVTLQDCSVSNTDSVTGYVDEDVCQAYGENCYFNERGLYADAAQDNDDEEEDAATEILDISSTYYSNCLDKTDMGCFFYDTKVDCLGEAGQQAQALVDIVYNDFDQAVLGTNIRLQESNDYFNYGACQWITTEGNSQGGYCVKNSNNVLEEETRDDCQNSDEELCYTDSVAPTTTLQLVSNSAVHNLPTYSLDTLKDLSYTVEDNVFLENDLELKVSFIPLNDDSLSCRQLIAEHEEDLTQQNIASQRIPVSFIPLLTGMATADETDSNSDLERSRQAQLTNVPSTDDAQSSQTPIVQRATSCANNGYQLYPVQNFEDVVDQLETVDALWEGEYLMLYYAEDEAQNREALNMAHIYLDTQNPQLTISYDVDSYQILEGDIYRSTLTYNFSIDEVSDCELQLSNIFESESPDAWHYYLDQTTQESVEFEQLVDGQYIANIECTDEAGNTVSNETIITVDGDISITSAYPHNHIFSSVDEINEFSIVTQQPGTCSFDEDNITTQGEFFFIQGPKNTDGTYKHIASVPTLDSTKEYFHFYTSCVFDDGTTTQNQEADSINFVIDTKGPQVILYHQNVVYEDDDYEDIYAPVGDEPPQLYDDNSPNIQWADERTFVVTCNDEPEFANSGCDVIHYCLSDALEMGVEFTPVDCIGNTKRTVSVDDEESFTELAEFSATTQANKHLHVWAEDGLGNIGDIVSVNMRLRETTFNEPEIILRTTGDTNEGL